MGCTTAPISFPDFPNEVSSSPDRRCIASFTNGQNGLSLQLLAALCDILGCGVEDLLTVTATDVRRQRATSATAAKSSSPKVVDINKSVRPRRARVLRDDD